MATHVYMTNPARIREFLEAIQRVGVPDKVTVRYLESLGFKSKNDRSLVRIIKALGFISSGGVPTERWQQYRDKTHAPVVLAQGLKEHYVELFKMYPDAHLKDKEALHNFFSSHTTVGANTLSIMIATFKVLADLADFEKQPGSVSAVPSVTQASTAQASPTQIPESGAALLQQQTRGGLTVNINIQLTLPENATPDTFDAFFKSMKKHLLD